MVIHLFAHHKVKRLRMKIREKEQEALRVQRHGYLRTYATMMLEIDALYEQLGQLTARE